MKGRPHRRKARALLRDSAVANIRLMAPPLFESEVDGAIVELAVSGAMTADEAKTMFARLDLLPVEIVHMAGVRHRSREIAQASKQRRCYDATYAALAGLRGCEFWTADRAFYQAVRKVLRFVKFVGHYRQDPKR